MNTNMQVHPQKEEVLFFGGGGGIHVHVDRSSRARAARPDLVGEQNYGSILRIFFTSLNNHCILATCSFGHSSTSDLVANTVHMSL